MTDLQPSELRMLNRLDDGPVEDSVGLRVDHFSRADHKALRALHHLRLVFIDVGWRDCVWCRLSPEGRIVKSSLLFR